MAENVLPAVHKCALLFRTSSTRLNRALLLHVLEVAQWWKEGRTFKCFWGNLCFPPVFQEVVIVSQYWVPSPHLISRITLLLVPNITGAESLRGSNGHSVPLMGHRQDWHVLKPWTAWLLTFLAGSIVRKQYPPIIALCVGTCSCSLIFTSRPLLHRQD